MIRSHPLIEGKDQDFWHITTIGDGKSEERLPDFRRCEQIAWIRAIIENASDPLIKVWVTTKRTGKHSSKRTHLLLEDHRFVVVLEKRSTYVLLITAFYIEQDHYLKKLRKDYESNLRSK